MGDVEAVKILQSLRGVYQLLKPVIPVLADADVVAYKLAISKCPDCFFTFLHFFRAYFSLVAFLHLFVAYHFF